MYLRHRHRPEAILYTRELAYSVSDYDVCHTKLSAYGNNSFFFQKTVFYGSNDFCAYLMSKEIKLIYNSC